ncbi:hypothetical protein ACLOJK_019464 [Asimina triloba]
MVIHGYHWGRRDSKIDATVTARTVQILLELIEDHEDEVRLSLENSLQAVMAAFDEDDGAPYLGAPVMH